MHQDQSDDAELEQLRLRVAQLEDVLERKSALTARSDDNVGLRYALEFCPIGIAIIAEDDGRRLFVNSALVDMLGWGSRDELLKGDISVTWANRSHMDEAMAIVRAKRNIVNLEAERIRRDGSRWWVLMNTQPIVFEGVAAGIVWHIDITQRKFATEAANRSENRFREAMESLSDAFALFDPDDRLIFCNRMFRELNPELAPNIRIGMTFEDMVRDNIKNGRIIEAKGREEEFVRERIAQHISPRDEPILSRRADGRWLLLREMRSPDGGFFLVNTDITELKNREDALREEKERAELANGFKSQFLATMSHELRTPLNAILGFSDILSHERFGPIGDERYRDYALDIFNSGEHLLDLINDVLDLSRIEAGEYDLAIQQVDVGDIVRSSCDILREEARNKGLRFTSSIADDLPMVRADLRAIRQILLNLLSNAVKFTDPGGDVSVRAEMDQKDSLSIVVADSGVGIAAEDMETILTPFSQVFTNGLANEGGTGLGLSIVNSLVGLQNGFLDIDSKLGEGTRVTVRFPISKEMPNGGPNVALRGNS